MWFGRLIQVTNFSILMAVLSLQLNGQTAQTTNTMRLAEGEKSPRALLQDISWITGTWKGDALGGQFEESWQPPSGDSMIGTFKLVAKDATKFTEFMTIVPHNDSLILKIKHFGADFQGWEEKDHSVDFPLVQLSPEAAYFEGLTFRKTGPDSLSIFVVMEGENGQQPQEVEFAGKLSTPQTTAETSTSGHSLDDGSVHELLAEIEAYINKVQRDWEVPGLAVSIVKDGNLLFSRGYGTRQLGTDQNVDGDTLFAIASNSKAFTAAALAILVDEGKVKWNDPVIQHFPQFQMPDPWITREMTIRDLLCHRSGMDTFSGDLLWYDTNHSADEIVRRIRYLKPVSSFRSQYGYQNLMYIAAGKVIEQVSGMSWADFIKARILQPAGMVRTTTSITGMKSNFAIPHNKSGRDESGGEVLRALPLGNVDNSWGACGLNSSVNDLARWMQIQLAGGTIDGKQILSKDRLFEMWQPNTLQPLSQAAVASDPNRNFQCYGLGYGLNDWHGKKIVGHSGGLDGMISHLAMVPSEKLGVVVLTNSESSASRFIRDRVLECFLGIEDRPDRSAQAIARLAAADQSNAKKRDELNAARKPNAPPTVPLPDLAGRFRSQLYGDVIVDASTGHLVLRMEPAPNFVADLDHWHYNTFRIRWRDTVKYNFPIGFVTFTIDAEGRPSQLTIDQPNNDFWFYELELKRISD